MAMAYRVLLANIVVVGMPVIGSAQQPTTEELKRWTAQVPPEMMESALTALSRPDLVKSLRMDDDIENHALPSTKQIDTVETALSQAPCIGSLGQWSRQYSFAVDYPHGRVDDGAIRFILREAGRHGFETGVRVGKPSEFAEIDDRQFRIAAGIYYLNNYRLKIDACSNNRRSVSAFGSGK